MKKIIVLFISLFFYISAFAVDKYKIKVLNEISYEQAQAHPRQWELTTYTNTNARGITTTRYFLFANSIKHNSDIVLLKTKQDTCPWLVRINGSLYYANFRDEDELKAGDAGLIKYNGDVLYFYKE